MDAGFRSIRIPSRLDSTRFPRVGAQPSRSPGQGRAEDRAEQVTCTGRSVHSTIATAFCADRLEVEPNSSALFGIMAIDWSESRPMANWLGALPRTATTPCCCYSCTTVVRCTEQLQQLQRVSDLISQRLCTTFGTVLFVALLLVRYCRSARAHCPHKCVFIQLELEIGGQCAPATLIRTCDCDCSPSPYGVRSMWSMWVLYV